LSITPESSNFSAEPVIPHYSGSRGTIAQVKCQLIGEGNRFLVRNVKGPVKKGDMITLLECEREARRLR
jgi:small subunit ribosomal protein S28e